MDDYDHNSGLTGYDADPEVLVATDSGGRLRIIGSDGGEVRQRTRLSGRDAYIARITHMMDDEEPPEPDEDEEPDEEVVVGPDGSPLSGRDVYLARLPGLCDEYSHDYQWQLSHRTVRGQR